MHPTSLMRIIGYIAVCLMVMYIALAAIRSEGRVRSVKQELAIKDAQISSIRFIKNQWVARAKLRSGCRCHVLGDIEP